MKSKNISGCVHYISIDTKKRLHKMTQLFYGQEFELNDTQIDEWVGFLKNMQNQDDVYLDEFTHANVPAQEEHAFYFFVALHDKFLQHASVDLDISDNNFDLDFFGQFVKDHRAIIMDLSNVVAKESMHMDTSELDAIHQCLDEHLPKFFSNNMQEILSQFIKNNNDNTTTIKSTLSGMR